MSDAAPLLGSLPSLPAEHPLPCMMNLAVRLWIVEFRRLTAAERAQRIEGAAQVIATKGDVLLYGSKREGEAAEVFNVTAKVLAVMAFQPGGVRAFGNHWQAVEDHTVSSPSEPAE